jgi:hypothetical protein
MKAKTKELLKQAIEICDKEDRSTAYTIQFMQDYAKVDFDCVIKYLEGLASTIKE